jgi:1-acyl-sn-glycerol-3-phosphate acyltransferase
MLALLRLFGHALFRILFTVEYHGLENVPETGPVIIAGNHPSYLDPVLVGIPIKRMLRFMAWDALFKVPLLGQIIRALGAFPVDIRRGKGESAYREAVRVLRDGNPLVIFPEGQRSDQGPMGELRTGAARLAIDTGAPIVPVTIGGAFRAWPKWRLLPKPAKIVVRYHKPIQLTDSERTDCREDRDFHRQLMGRVAGAINRSLSPALREAEHLERWYRQPPPHIRSYEWAPLLAALVATVIAWTEESLSREWLGICAPPAVYYLYIIWDLSVIKPSRSSKWLRNSMPIWLILVWHYPLVRALRLTAGELNPLLIAAALAAFFPFFWEDYYTLQKFVRGLVVVYYFSLALLLGLPHPLGTLVAVLSFITAFAFWHRTLYYPTTIAVMLVIILVAIVVTRSASWSLAAYVALSLSAIAYLQTFVSVAYDIRKAGNVV